MLYCLLVLCSWLVCYLVIIVQTLGLYALDENSWLAFHLQQYIAAYTLYAVAQLFLFTPAVLPTLATT